MQLGADVASVSNGAANISFSGTTYNQTAAPQALQVSTDGGQETFGGAVGGGASGTLAGLSTAGSATRLNAANSAAPADATAALRNDYQNLRSSSGQSQAIVAERDAFWMVIRRKR